MTVEYEIARNNPILHHAPIFTPIKKGRRKKAVEVERICAEGTLRVMMFHQCDVADEDLFLTILALAGDDAFREAVPQSESLIKMSFGMGRADDKTVFSMSELPALKLSITRYSLLREAQRQVGSRDYKWLNESLTRLALMSFVYDGARWNGVFNLLSFALNKETELYDIQLNPVTAYSIYASTAQYIKIQRNERHQLHHDISKSLHSYLSGVVRVGEVDRPLDGETLIKSIYNIQADEPVNASTMRARRKAVMDAIDEINTRLVKWKIKVTGKGAKRKVKVSRIK